MLEAKEPNKKPALSLRSHLTFMVLSTKYIHAANIFKNTALWLINNAASKEIADMS